MALIVKNNTFSAGTVIVASEHNSNFDTIYNDYNGNITNANIAAGAGIVDSKLAQITTASKVAGDALTLLANTPSGAGALPEVNGGTNQTTYTQGDIIYSDGANSLAKLGAGTAGQALITGGAAANPSFAGMTTEGDIEYRNATTRARLAVGTAYQTLRVNAGATAPEYVDEQGVFDYSTSASSSTTKRASALQIAYGRQTIAGNGNQAITNLPFASSATFSVALTFQSTSTTSLAGAHAVINSGAQFTIYNASDSSQTIYWTAIGT